MNTCFVRLQKYWPCLSVSSRYPLRYHHVPHSSLPAKKAPRLATAKKSHTPNQPQQSPATADHNQLSNHLNEPSRHQPKPPMPPRTPNHEPPPTPATSNTNHPSRSRPRPYELPTTSHKPPSSPSLKIPPTNITWTKILTI